MQRQSKSQVISLIKKAQDLVNDNLILLGSANFPYPNLRKINGLLLDFNAAEGTRQERLFPGCNILNEIESYGENLFNNMFTPQLHYNVLFDPLSGTQANQIVYNAILQKGDIVLSLSEKSGGHASHIDFLKKYYTVHEYGFNNSTQNIDYKQIDTLCAQYHPKLIIAGASTFPLEINYTYLHSICKKYNSLLLADISHTVLYIYCKKHDSPFGYADFITFTTHKTTRGPRGAILAYNPAYQKQIEYSTFPLSQGAPIFSQICSKVLMLEEMEKDDLFNYCARILSLTKLFIKEMNKYNIPVWTNKSDSHICVIDISKYCNNSRKMQSKLEQNNIFVNSCWLPWNNNMMTGLRLGFMLIATLNISESDFIKLIEIIVKIMKGDDKNYKNTIINIISQYLNKYKEKELS